VLWRKQADGRWLIAHDHCSAPFNPYMERVVLSPDEPAGGEAAPDSCGDRNPAGWFEIYVEDMERAKGFYGAVFGVEPEDNARAYLFGDKTIEHRFCPVCGIHPYGEGTLPDGTRMAAVNVRCLEGVDVAALPVKRFDGRSL